VRYKALLLDFYGTLVAEDDPVITNILNAIAACSPISSDIKKIGRDWRFQEMCKAAYGDSFKSQRTLELESLTFLLSDHKAELDPQELSNELFSYWRSPEVFDDARYFLQNNTRPVCIVSNIDTHDINAASTRAGWNFEHLVTSEICRSYKPRPEMFLAALEKLKCNIDEVLHIGDSLSSDVVGAQELGIDTAWVNRKGRKLPEEIAPPTFLVKDLRELTSLLT
jgi:2-haloacid dehalogenase/putative hydrolase of the HAD superfamily